ncbi:BnaAnng04460D [Brassica napus]|uniref:BnaAnng04460D protein n=2 Tax=Brassica TaxID=3705 RepID=A0A078HCR1_BRANA|nr:BnaAnng04460D [Brassica napus]
MYKAVSLKSIIAQNCRGWI